MLATPNTNLRRILLVSAVLTLALSACSAGDDVPAYDRTSVEEFTQSSANADPSLPGFSHSSTIKAAAGSSRTVVLLTRYLGKGCWESVLHARWCSIPGGLS
jgi:hypothetical protein